MTNGGRAARRGPDTGSEAEKDSQAPSGDELPAGAILGDASTPGTEKTSPDSMPGALPDTIGRSGLDWDREGRWPEMA